MGAHSLVVLVEEGGPSVRRYTLTSHAIPRASLRMLCNFEEGKGFSL